MSLKENWKIILLATTSSIIMGFSMPVRNYLTALFIEEFSNYKGIESEMVHRILNLIKMCAIYGIIAWIFTVVERFLWHYLSIQYVKVFRNSQEIKV